MFSNQIGNPMSITYLPLTSHLQFYNLLPTYLPTYLLTYSPTTYHLLTFILHNLVVMRQNKHVK